MLDEKEIEKFLNREDVVRDINIRSHHYTFQDTYIYIPELKSAHSGSFGHLFRQHSAIHSGNIRPLNAEFDDHLVSGFSLTKIKLLKQ